jgi:hypothetical protein
MAEKAFMVEAAGLISSPKHENQKPVFAAMA